MGWLHDLVVDVTRSHMANPEVQVLDPEFEKHQECVCPWTCICHWRKRNCCMIILNKTCFLFFPLENICTLWWIFKINYIGKKNVQCNTVKCPRKDIWWNRSNLCVFLKNASMSINIDIMTISNSIYFIYSDINVMS